MNNNVCWLSTRQISGSVLEISLQTSGSTLKSQSADLWLHTEKSVCKSLAPHRKSVCNNKEFQERKIFLIELYVYN
jgi:hypothetical protein